MAEGAYHYNVAAHRLDMVRHGQLSAEFEDATFDLFKKYEDAPRALVVFTALYERAMWRYRDPRSWRAVLLDVGHAVAAFRELSSALGFYSYTYQKFKDSNVAQLLTVDVICQTPLYVATLV